MTKLEMALELVKMGYYLFGETPEHFANRLDEKTMKIVYEAQKKRVGK